MKKLCNYRFDSDDRQVLAKLTTSLGTKNASETLRFALRVVAMARGIQRGDMPQIAQTSTTKPLDG
jgi:hypothetical protein